MTILRRTTMLSLLSIFLFFSLQSQESILLGSVSVTLGMKKDLALAKFKDSPLGLSKIQGDAWMIYEKEKADLPIRKVGILIFENGILSSAQRTWATSENADAIGLMGKLFAALRSKVSEESKRAEIRAFELNQPGVFHKTIDIWIDNRRFTISQTTGDGVASDVEIYEVLQQSH